MNPGHDLSAAFDEIALGAARTAYETAALDPQALVEAAHRRRRRMVAVTAAASAAALVVIGGVGAVLSLDDAPPSPPAQTAAPPSPAPTDSAPVSAADPVTGSVGADVCGRPLGELPWRADDRVQLSSDAGPQLDGTALEIDTALVSREGSWMTAPDLDAVALDSSGLVVAYLTDEASNESVAGRTTGTLVPCESGTGTLPAGTYTFVLALAFVEITPAREVVGATPAHAVAQWDLVVPAEGGDSP